MNDYITAFSIIIAMSASSLSQLLHDPSLSQLANQAGGNVTRAIHNAAARTDVDFGYLLQQAATESSFRVDVQAQTSSARGLFQFIDKTWLQAIDKYGDKYGLGEYSQAISANGHVNDQATKQEILALRDDPEISSLMAAELASDNKRVLENNLNKVAGGQDIDIGAAELYLAHFLGAGGASNFLENLVQNPDAKGAAILPQAAKANERIFYHDNGQQKSVQDIYDHFAQKFEHVSAPDLSVADDALPTQNDVLPNINSDINPNINDALGHDNRRALRVYSFQEYQRAFFPHRERFDRAVQDLLLSPNLSGLSDVSDGSSLSNNHDDDSLSYQSLHDKSAQDKPAKGKLSSYGVDLWALSWQIAPSSHQLNQSLRPGQLSQSGQLSQFSQLGQLYSR